MYLLDTNVISEMRKGANGNPGVVKFAGTVDAERMFIAVQTVGELRRGADSLRLRGDAAQALKVEAWLTLVLSDYASRIIRFDLDCALMWGRLSANDTQNLVDKQLASIGLIHGLTVVTRNVRHFASTGVALENPFT